MKVRFAQTSLTFGALVAITLGAARVTGAAVPAAAPAAPFSFDAAPGRLPKTVVPIDFTISISPNAVAKTIAGRESILVQVRRPTTKIVLNSLDERLSGVRFDGASVANIDTQNGLQLTTITLKTIAPVGRHTLAFAYTGKINTDPIGLYVQPYKQASGVEGSLLSTQFEATDARRMFPCWDEPAFRATYVLTVTVPAAWSTVSNMPIAKRVEHGALATTTFLRSPKMPSYLVELSAGDLAAIFGRSGATKLGVWTVRGQAQNGRVALANAARILADYNDYFGYRFPLPKLDSIAVPGGHLGAMENWGAITYNDQLLLVTPSSTVGQRQQIFSAQAHEMAHQWNGDLVTMGWWDDIWLNESFASWRSAKETDFRNPTWNWWEGQDADKEDAMSADAHVTSHPIAQHVTDELKARSAFDPAITYSKGQAVLRMLEAYLGPNTFRDGVRRYIKARAYSNATSADLWNALGSVSRKDVDRIASGWILQPGFPLVSVAATCGGSNRRTVALRQKRFLLEGTDAANAHWDIPLDIRSGSHGTPQALLLTSDGQTAPAGKCDEPLSVNAGGAGFYRVAYDDATLAINRANFAALPAADKIVMLDDQWALVGSGSAKLPTYLGLAESLGSNVDARAWEQIAESLGDIEHDERGTVGHDAFTVYARKLIKPVADQLGWDEKANEPPDVIALRHTLVGDLGAWGDAPTIAQARKRFAQFVARRDSVPPDDQQTLLSIVALHADQATFDQLHAIAKSARDQTEQLRYFSALMTVRDPTLARQALAIALSPEIPKQAQAIRIRLVSIVADHNPRLSWQAFTRNYQALLAPMGTFEPLVLAQYVPPIFRDAVPLPELKRWVAARIPAEYGPELSRGMNAARFAVNQKAALVPAADAYVTAAGSRNRAAAPSRQRKKDIGDRLIFGDIRKEADALRVDGDGKT